ncbi:MAG: S1 family peptidase [Labedaea sp.]
MRISRLLAAMGLAMVTVTAMTAGGAMADQTGRGIIGGGRASTVDYPFVVYLATPSGFQFCGGTLVSARAVVTAAHCVADSRAADLQVVAGRDDKQGQGGVVARVSRIWVHPDFREVSSGADVAVLTLAVRLPYRPAALARPSEPELYQPGTASTILGWGRTREGGPASRYLLAATVGVIGDADCARAYARFSASAMVCAGYSGGGVDACQGDSGGPMLVAGRLAGIASWGEGCARRGKPGVYTRVAAYASLIAGQI